MYYKILLLLLIKILDISSIENNKCNRIYDNQTSHYCIECENFDIFPVETLREVYIKNSDIQLIKFINSTLSNIPTGAFQSISVEKVDLSSLQIQTLETGCFLGLENVSEINLGYNKLSRLNSEIFNSLSCLKDLYLQSNEISFIENNTFMEMVLLETLNLNSNKIEMLSNDIFSSLTNLKRLHLAENYLNTFSFNLSNVPLEYLYIWRNQIIFINSLPETLIHLNVENNKLTDLDFVSELHNLISLFMNLNNLTEITLNSFASLTELETLHLKSNQISSIHIGSMSSLKNLEHLFLSDNLIEELDFGTLNGLKKLNCLDISHNKIDSLNEQIFYDVKTLEKLDISNTNIQKLSVHDLVYQCPNLTKLIIFGLKFTCTELYKIIDDAELENIEIEEGQDVTTTNINGYPCTKTESNSLTNCPSDDLTKEIRIGDHIVSALEKSSLFEIIANLSDTNREMKNDLHEMKQFLESECKNSCFYKTVKNTNDSKCTQSDSRNLQVINFS